MFGDFILWIKQSWKEFWCIHDYQYTGLPPYRYESMKDAQNVED